MNLETELCELAQTHLELIQDIQWHDLRRAVVIHLESMEEQDTLIIPRIQTRQVCHHIINQKPCPKWTDGTACGATWHPEFLQILEDGQPKWIWMPRQTICRSDQRSRGVKHQQGQLSCTDPNCIRSHAPNWLYAELWAFRWWVQHEFNTGLATGYTLNGDLIGMSIRTANLTLATMPYVDEAYYHKFRWHAPIPQPETYGDMIVTAPSRRANLHNEQPRRGRASTPRRHNTPKRHVTPPRPVVTRAEAPPAPTPDAPTHPWLTPDTNWDEDPWTRAEREHAEQQEARAKAKAPPPPAPYSAQAPPAGPPVTPSINPPRQHRVEQTPITRAFETLRQTAGSSVQSIPASVPAPSPTPAHTELTQMTTPADANLMTQSWNLISGFSDYTVSTKNPRHHTGRMVSKTTDPIYPPVATNTHAWHAVPLTRRQQLPIEQSALDRVHILAGEPLPGEHWHMGHNHTRQHDTTSSRPSSLRSPSADTHGLRNTNRRRLSTQVLVAPTSPARQECGTRTLRQ